MTNRRTLLLLTILFSCHLVRAQAPTGFPRLGSLQSTGFDTINQQDLNVNFSIPILSKPGRGLTFSPTLSYNSLIWVNTGYAWAPVVDQNGAPTWGWGRQSPVGQAQYTRTRYRCVANDSTNQWTLRYHGYYFVDSSGTTRSFDLDVYVAEQPTQYPECGNGNGPFSTYAGDGSGYLLSVPNIAGYTQSAQVYAPAGTDVDFAGPKQDTNGNSITNSYINSSETDWIDTLGQTALKVINNSGNTQYEYRDTSGTWQSVTMNLTPLNVRTNFGCSGVSEYAASSIPLPTSITRPDGSSYTLTYEGTPGWSGWVTGRIASIKLPTGGTIYYSYSGGNGGVYCADGSVATLVRATPYGSTTYSRTGSATASTTTITDGLNNQSVVTFSNSFETKRDIYQGAVSGNPLERIVTCYAGETSDPMTVCANATVNTSSIGGQFVYRSWPASGLWALTSTSLDGFGRVTAVKQYDWGSYPNGALLSQSHTSYASFSGNLLNRPSSVVVQDGGGNQRALTNYYYDQSAPSPTSGVPQHGLPNGSRGNLTKISQWLNTTGGYLNSTVAYDDTGNVLSTTDPNGNTTSFAYSTSYANAYLTQTTMPNTVNSSHHIASATYDSNSGLPLSITDPNSNLTNYTYDALLRPSTVSYPDGGSLTYTYTPTSVETKQKLDGAGNVVDQTINLDGLGRQSSTLLVDPEGNDTTETTYDADGRVYSVSNPHRGTSSGTDGTSYYAYDALDRITQVTDQDGATAQTSYSGNTVTVTDEAGRKRESVVDGLGRMAQVIEPNPASNSLTSGALSTNYAYAVTSGGASTLTMTQSGDGSQSARVRTLTYDSLSRLVTSAVPESGQTGYQYDSNGNTTQISDARGVTTTIGYDALNRPTSKSYSDGTPAVTLSYDEASPWGIGGSNNTVGQLSSTWVSGSLAGSIYIYDSMGRLVRNDQCAKSICGTSSYPVYASYDYAGDLTSLTYPSGRKVVNSYNNAARLTKVNYDSYSGTGVNYPYYSVPQSTSSSAWGYFPAGALNRFSFGPGVSETLNANNRLMLNQITASTAAQTLVSKSYGFASPNNGNITQIADNLNSGRTQNFGYDYLNRLTSANTSATSGSDAWSEAYTIDPWSNTKQSGSYAFTPNFDANNRISQTGYNYDGAGNLLTDTFHTYAYDAESRMKTVDSTNGIYTYAADGTRSRKDIPGDYTEYVYFGGQAIAEKNSAGDWNDYIFANGQRIAKAEGLDNGLRSYGTTTGSGQWAVQYFGNAAGLNGYTIQSGDKLYLNQYQVTGSKGGMVLGFSDGSNSNWGVHDAEGYFLNDDQTQNASHVRTVDLSSLAGKTINAVALNQEGDTSVGSWAMIYEQISLVSTDGSVHPIYTGQPSSPLTSNLQSGGETGLGSTIDINRGHGIYPTQATTYYLGDHLGSSRMILSGNGYPVWSGVFLPFGQEWNPQITMNHYKFTGDEHDSESNLEHTQFRQYEATQGRWLSPDPYLGSMDPTNPQSFNRYTYVLNNPLSFTDPDGLDCVYDLGDGWAGVLAGDCASPTDSGYYVNGTVDTNSSFSFDSNTGDLQFGYTDSNGVYGTHDIPGFSDPTYGNTGDQVDSVFNQMRQNYFDRMNALNAIPTSDQYIRAIVNGAPTVCGGGFFAYGGPAGGNEPNHVSDTRHGGVQGFWEWDSRNNFKTSKGTVVEGQVGPAGGGVVFNKGNAEPFIFGGAGPGGVIFFPTSGAAGVYGGGSYGGAGAYLNFTTNAGCKP